MNVIENYVLLEGKSLGLKVAYEDGKPESWYAPEGFRWNLTLGGETVAPDWDPEPVCGGGLHVWEWAQGNIRASSIWYRPDVIWTAVEYETASTVDLKEEIKVPKCKTVAVSSDRKEVISFIQGLTPEEKRGPVLDALVVEAEEGIAIAGDGRAAVAGKGGAAIAGRYGLAIAGEGGKARVGEEGCIYLQKKCQGWVYLSEGWDIHPNTFYRLDDSDRPVRLEDNVNE